MSDLDNTARFHATLRSREWTDYIPVVTGIAALAIALTLVLFARSQALPFWKPLILFAIAFCCEFVDSSLGMGYGTTFTPLLILMGYDLHTIVPVVLLSEFLTGMTAGGFHHALGNAQFTLHSRDSRIAVVLVITGIFGALIAVQFLVHIPRYWVKLYFALMITAMGLLIILNRNGSYRFSAVPIVAGAMLSAPCASMMTRFLHTKFDLKKLVGVVVLLLGIVCLLKVL